MIIISNKTFHWIPQKKSLNYTVGYVIGRNILNNKHDMWHFIYEIVLKKQCPFTIVRHKHIYKSNKEPIKMSNVSWKFVMMDIAHETRYCMCFHLNVRHTNTNIVVHITPLQRNVEKVYVVDSESLSPIEQHWFISICRYETRFRMLPKRPQALSSVYHFINYYSILTYEHIQHTRGHMWQQSTHLNNYCRLARIRTITLSLRGGLGNDGPVPV